METEIKHGRMLKIENIRFEKAESEVRTERLTETEKWKS